MSTGNAIALSPAESRELLVRESRIERGIQTFIEVGNDLLAIKESRLYRQGHDSFEAYCQGRWGMTGRRARQLIDSAHTGARIAEAAKESGTIVPAPTCESQLRPLVALTGEEASEAWQDAVARSDGAVPTAKTVAAVVAEKKGQSRVNGVLQDDPEDVARQRRNGRIPEGAVVAVTLPDAEPEPEAEAEAEVPDEEWLASLPLHGKLAGGQAKVFEADALAYRRMEGARRAYKHALSRLPRTKKKGPWRWSQDMAMGKEDPSRWIACPAPDHGGCGGAGIMPLGPCVKCRGNGFIIP